MVVCVCETVGEQEIIQSIQKGNQDLESLQKDLGVCQMCGCCEFELQELLEKHTSN